MLKMKPTQDKLILLAKLYTYLIFGLLGQLALSSPASAGSAAGPYIVWFNLDEPNDSIGIDDRIRSFLKDDEFHCDGRWYRHSSILFMKKRPALITRGLIRSVFIEHDPSSTTVLNGILKSYRDLRNGVDGGMDGIIVYGSEGGAKMSSLTTGKRKVSSINLPASETHPPSSSDIGLAFCYLLPTITRQP